MWIRLVPHCAQRSVCVCSKMCVFTLKFAHLKLVLSRYWFSSLGPTHRLLPHKDLAEGAFRVKITLL